MILAESNKRFSAPGCKFVYMQAFQKLLSIENWEIPMEKILLNSNPEDLINSMH